MKNLLKIIKVAQTAGYLKRLKRTGWVRIGVKDAESVADHSFRTALLCMLLTKSRKINYQKIVEMAIIHDLGETATSDIRYEEGNKIIASEKAKEKLEEDVLKTIFEPLDDGKYYLDLWYEFRDQSTEEARLLKQIEKIEMALQAVEYKKMGLPEPLTREFIINAKKYVKDNELKKILSSIIKD
jgi:5'-deoxynucleotidase YfbR-like HD superfamily hydrolase